LSFLSSVATVLITSLVFIAILITGVGTVGMIVIQEILPDRLRGLGTGLTYSFGMLIAGNGPTAVAMINEWAYSGEATGVAISMICSPISFLSAGLLAFGVVLHRQTYGPSSNSVIPGR
jgi:hypothetical protein